MRFTSIPLALLIALTAALVGCERRQVPPTPTTHSGRSMDLTTGDADSLAPSGPGGSMVGPNGGPQATDGHALPIETQPVDRVAILEGYLTALAATDAPTPLVADFERAYRLTRQADVDATSRDFNAALALVANVIAARPEFGPAYAVRGYCKFWTRDFDGAAADYRQAITFDSANAEAMYGLAGMLVMSGGDLNEARRLRDGAVALGMPDVMNLDATLPR